MQKEVLLNEFPQPNKVREAMRRADIRHGEAVRVDMDGVRVPHAVELQPGELVAVRFCDIEALTVHSRPLRQSGRTPPKVREEPLKLFGADRLRNLEPGWYTLRNVALFTNGCVRLTIDEASDVSIDELDMVPEEPSAIEELDLNAQAEVFFRDTGVGSEQLDTAVLAS